MGERVRERPRSDGLRLTKVGLWFVLFALIVSIAATNTGNNGLYLVLALQVGVLAIAHLIARVNVGGLALALEAPAEVFANRPAHFAVELRNPSPWLARWWLIAALEPSRRRAPPFFVPALGARGRCRGDLELLLERRGRYRVRSVHLASLFPLGLFRKGARYPVDVELLVYPEIFGASSLRPEQAGRAGEEPTRRVGWGHELLSLRPYRHGDDPRAIHWKHSARTGALIFTERESEETRRLSIVFDNAVGEALSSAERNRFERLVSEAATAALDHLGRGFEVALSTREGRLDFAGGPRQRRRILERLATIEPVARNATALAPESVRGVHLRLALALPRAEAA